MTAPPPLEWHPWYRDRTYLWPWLNSEGAHGDCTEVRVPVYPLVPARYHAPGGLPDELIIRSISIVRRTAWGPAPYVGCPYVYTWPVGVDSLGREIAGESTIRYLPHDRWNRCAGTCTMMAIS